MSEVAIIALLFGAGTLVLIAELFIPSHGVLTIVGVALLVAGIVQTFRYGGELAGTISVLTCLVVLPVLAVVTVRVWPQTWVGRKIAPPNPVITLRDTSVPVEEISRYVGQTGRSVTPLRPVGICDFNGQRVSCIAELGMLETGVSVEGLRMVSGQLAVKERKA